MDNCIFRAKVAPPHPTTLYNRIYLEEWRPAIGEAPLLKSNFRHQLLKPTGAMNQLMARDHHAPESK